MNDNRDEAVFSHDNGLMNSKSAYLDGSFAELDLAVFVACHSADGQTTGNNLITSIVEKGAKVAVGFEGEILCDTSNKWTRLFFDMLAMGETVLSAVNYANEKSGLTGIIAGDSSFFLG